MTTKTNPSPEPSDSRQAGITLAHQDSDCRVRVETSSSDGTEGGYAEEEYEQDEEELEQAPFDEFDAIDNHIVVIRRGWVAFQSTGYEPPETRRPKRKWCEYENESELTATKQRKKRKVKDKDLVMSQLSYTDSEQAEVLLSPRLTKYTAEEKTFLNPLFRQKLEYPKYTYADILKAFKFMFRDNPPRTEDGIRHLKDKMGKLGELEGPFPNYY
jgi:hypothetical protein